MADIRDLVAAQRGDLADVLDGLTAADWDAPTLCAGWRVRETVAHITMPFRYSGPRFMLELAKNRGSFNAMSDRLARRDAARLSAADLAGALRSGITHPWKPPGGGFQGALAHDIIHGLDITVPLGLAKQIPAERLRLILPASPTERSVTFFGTDLTGVELRATDLDWTLGSGSPVTGPAQNLLLAICGRQLPPGSLHGEHSARFTSTGE